MIEWISVNDRLPESCDGKSECPTVLGYCAPGRREQNLVQVDPVSSEWIRGNPGEYSHWMPLPDPPNGK